MTQPGSARRVVVLAPMPLEHKAIVKAFGLSPVSADKKGPWAGRVGSIEVVSIHIGMGPPMTREATSRVLEHGAPTGGRVDHVMIAGICGGLDPALEVGTVINPEIITGHTTGLSYRHHPPGDARLVGKLITTEGVTLDPELSKQFFEAGYIGVDMESSAVAEVCESVGRPWSVYRCIGDRQIDGLLDERLVAMTKPDGSGDRAEVERLIASEPGLAAKLERLGRDAAMAAQRAAEAAFRACQILDG